MPTPSPLEKFSDEQLKAELNKRAAHRVKALTAAIDAVDNAEEVVRAIRASRLAVDVVYQFAATDWQS